MYPEVVFVLERLPAILAIARRDRVPPHMTPEVRVQVEHLRAKMTVKRKELRVPPNLVSLHVVHSPRQKAAFGTLEYIAGPLVDVHVHLQGLLILQLLVAHGALVRGLQAVSLQVLPQVVIAAECFMADLAHERP